METYNPDKYSGNRTEYQYEETNTTKYDDDIFKSFLFYSIELIYRSYSHIFVKKALDSKSGWILATNICFEKKSRQYHIYSINGKPINIRKHGKQCLFLIISYYF